MIMIFDFPSWHIQQVLHNILVIVWQIQTHENQTLAVNVYNVLDTPKQNYSTLNFITYDYDIWFSVEAYSTAAVQHFGYSFATFKHTRTKSLQ